MAIIKPADILSLNDEDSLDSKESFDVSNLAGYIRSKFVSSPKPDKREQALKALSLLRK